MHHVEIFIVRQYPSGQGSLEWRGAEWTASWWGRRLAYTKHATLQSARFWLRRAAQTLSH